MSFFSSFISATKTASAKTQSLLRFLVMKTIGLILAVMFLFLALVFLGYGLIAGVTATQKAKDAKITGIADGIGKHSTACRVGGLFVLETETGKIYSLYPVWPDKLSPSLGDWVRVWPAQKPLVAFPGVDGWAWFMVATIVVLGFLFLEFAFLSLLIK
jgi:hypothetical protein